MKIRWTTLWRVPVYCLVASWVSAWITVYGGFFYVVKTQGADGVMEASVDPIRGAVFNGMIFLAVLLLGGLWFFRSMTKAEIAVSSAIISAIYFIIVLPQLFLPNFPLSLSIELAWFQNWTSILSSFLFDLTDLFSFSVLISNFAPFLFVLFGKKQLYAE